MGDPFQNAGGGWYDARSWSSRGAAVKCASFSVRAAVGPCSLSSAFWCSHC